MNHDAGAVCLCRATHAPAPLELNHHHIHPQEYGGPTVPENMVWVCPTTHANIHELLRLIIRCNGTLPWGEVLTMYEVPVSRYAFDLAHEGYRRMHPAGG